MFDLLCSDPSLVGNNYSGLIRVLAFGWKDLGILGTVRCAQSLMITVLLRSPLLSCQHSATEGSRTAIPTRPSWNGFRQLRSVLLYALHLVSFLWVAMKCLVRLHAQIIIHSSNSTEQGHHHPWIWLIYLVSFAFSSFHTMHMPSHWDRMENSTTRNTHSSNRHRGRRQQIQPLLDIEQGRQESSSAALMQPLLDSSEEPSSSIGIQQEPGPPITNSPSTNLDARQTFTGLPNNEPTETKHHTVQWTDLIKLCYPDKYLVMIALVFLCGTAICQVYIPKLTGQLLDSLIEEKPSTDSIHIPAGFRRNIELLVLVSVLAGIFGGIRGAIFTMVGARINVRLRMLLMDRLLSLHMGFYDTARTGDITSRLSSDTTLVGSSIMTNVNIFLRSAIRSIGVLAFMFAISWQLSLLAFITVPIVTLLSKWYGRFIRKLTKLQQDKLADGNSISDSTISSIATVKIFGAEQAEMRDFEQCMKNYLHLNLQTAAATLGYIACVNALPQLVKALVLYYGGLFVQTTGEGHISGGQLVSFILYLTSLSESINSLGGIYASLVRAVGAADKIFELLNESSSLTPPSRGNAEAVREALRVSVTDGGMLGVQSHRIRETRMAGLSPEQCRGLVSFENVHFTYPSRPEKTVLQGMDFTIEPGSVVAIVGSSGSGKTSTIKLLQHLYEAQSGQVKIDGYPVQELSMDWLSKNIAVVSQDPVIYARSIRSNIIYGLEGTPDEPTQEEIEEAARKSNADSFIASLPEKYKTTVGERGIQLSGGQRQRIALARALVRKPRLLLLDEATSALDAESEHLVASAISEMISSERLSNGNSPSTTTVIIIAHRLSTIRNSDRILVVNEGKIAEDGNHDELLKKNGLYSALVRRQLGDDGNNPIQRGVSFYSEDSSRAAPGLVKTLVSKYQNKGSSTGTKEQPHWITEIFDKAFQDVENEIPTIVAKASRDYDSDSTITVTPRKIVRSRRRSVGKQRETIPLTRDQISPFQFGTTPAKDPEPSYMFQSPASSTGSISPGSPITTSNNRSLPKKSFTRK